MPLQSGCTAAEQSDRMTAPGVAEDRVGDDAGRDACRAAPTPACEHHGSVSQGNSPNPARFRCHTVPMSDLILTAATIITMDDDVPRAQAVAVSGDTIVAVGSVEDCRAALPGAEVVDTGVAVLAPGFR